MRERLPRRELGHRVGLVEQFGQFGGQIVGLASVGRDHEQGRIGVLGEAGHHKGAGGVGGGEVDVHFVTPGADSRDRGVCTGQLGKPDEGTRSRHSSNCRCPRMTGSQLDGPRHSRRDPVHPESTGPEFG